MLMLWVENMIFTISMIIFVKKVKGLEHSNIVLIYLGDIQICVFGLVKNNIPQFCPTHVNGVTVKEVQNCLWFVRRYSLHPCLWIWRGRTCRGRCDGKSENQVFLLQFKCVRFHVDLSKRLTNILLNVSFSLFKSWKTQLFNLFKSQPGLKSETERSCSM